MVGANKRAYPQLSFSSLVFYFFFKKKMPTLSMLPLAALSSFCFLSIAAVMPQEMAYSYKGIADMCSVLLLHSYAIERPKIDARAETTATSSLGVTEGTRWVWPEILVLILQTYVCLPTILVLPTPHPSTTSCLGF
jgi:hypothetical protein